MDGIAVRAADTAGAAPDRPLRLDGTRFDLVDTGDPLPAGRDAVVMRERVAFEDGVATIGEAVARGRHVRTVGEDVAAGELVLAPGQHVRPFDVALAAAGGVTELVVRRRTVVTILPTGDELRPAGAALAAGELADTNSPMLEAQALQAGCETRRGPILPDDPDRLVTALRAAAAEADLVVLVAGTSAGRGDYAPEVIRRCGRIVVRGVAIRPGHPVVLGVVDGTAVMACPGYPVSAALAFDALALPLLASFEQAAAPRRPVAAAQLAAGVRSKPGSRELLRVRLGTVAGRRVAVPLRRGASVLSSLAHADALLAVPAERDGLSAGAAVELELLRDPADAVLVAGAPDAGLDQLALLLGDAARLGFCELAPAEAVALVRAGGCHAALFAGAPDDPEGLLEAVRLVDVDVVLAGDIAPRPGARVAVGPAGTPARQVLDAVAGAYELVEARSDAAAFAAVVGGAADCAAGALAAARAAGLASKPLGRASLDLVIRRDAPERDPLVHALLKSLRRHQMKETTR
jgi:putative molybdopterin biosynthesis protein